MGILDLFKRTPTPAKFAQIVMQAARERGVGGPMEFDASNFRIVLGKNDVVNLHNFYHDYCQAPRTDRIALVSMDGAGEPRQAGVVSWEQVEAAAGHLMQPEPDSYPPRYRVTQFPDLASLGLQ